MQFATHYVPSLLQLKESTGSSVLYGEDHMDDGTIIKLKITISDDVSVCYNLTRVCFYLSGLLYYEYRHNL